MWGQLHKGGDMPPGSTPYHLVTTPHHRASSSCALPPGFQMPHSPLSGLDLACWLARCLVRFQTQGSDWLLSVPDRARPVAGGWLGLVGAAIWVMGIPSKAPAELRPLHSPLFSLTEVSEPPCEGPPIVQMK